MKEGLSLLIPWTLKEQGRNSINNCMPQNLITEMKHTNFLKDPTTKIHTRRKKRNKLTPVKEIESMINDFPKQRMGLNGFIGKFIQKFISKKKKRY